MIIQDYSNVEDAAVAAAQDDDNDDGNELGEEDWFYWQTWI